MYQKFFYITKAAFEIDLNAGLVPYTAIVFVQKPAVIWTHGTYYAVDALYGPYESVEAACEAVPTALRDKGLTVGIINTDGEVEEYWWKKGITNEELEEKVEKPNVITSDDIDNIVS